MLNNIQTHQSIIRHGKIGLIFKGYDPHIYEMIVMRIKTCKDCGESLDSVDHLMRCQVPDKTWKSGKDSKAGEWD